MFTFGIGTIWGFLKYRPELFSTTEPFLILFTRSISSFRCFMRCASRTSAAARRRQPRVRYAAARLPLQAALLDGDTKMLASSALVLALAHVGVAVRFAFRRLAMTLLGQSHALLALGFATLPPCPLALSARSTACAWAVEGAALVWLGLRQRRQFPRVIGYLLQLAAGVSLVSVLVTRADPAQIAILNGDFLAILLLTAAGFVSTALLRRENETSGMAQCADLVAGLVGRARRQRDRPLRAGRHRRQLAARLCRADRAARERSGSPSRLERTALAGPAFDLAAPLFIAATTAANDGGPLNGYGIAAWAAWFLASLFAQRNLESTRTPGLAAPTPYGVHLDRCARYATRTLCTR